jgi:ATP-binding cassette subfamily B protein
MFFFIVGPIMMLTEVAGDVIMPKLMSLIINEGVKEFKSMEYIISMGIKMVVLAFVMMLGGVLGNYFAARGAISFAADLRKDVFKKVQSFSFKNIDEFSTGSLVTRLTNDITQMQNVLRMAMVMMLRSPGMLVGAFIMAIGINARLALIIGIVTPILAFGIYLIMSKALPRFTIMQKKLDTLNTNIQENLTNIRVVKSFVRTSFEEEKFSKSNSDLRDNSIKALKIMICTMPLMTAMMNITTLAVVWYGGSFVIKGSMPVGDLMAFITYITQILMSLMMLSMIILQGSRALASARRITEILDTNPDITDDDAKCRDALVTRGEIEFKDVSFGYSSGKTNYVLSDISFKINAGETVGILGSTGSGKTSLVGLIPRLYDATKGTVTVDGIDVKDYCLKNLRDGVGMVLQKNVLFSGTIMENLKWGNEEATDEEILLCAEHAQAHGFITESPDGYEKELGQGGVNVSGGQRQRLCIARALLKKPKILILDDSTSALDTATEARIRENFKEDLKDTTKIIIAQRITSVMDADKIIVIDDGKIIAIGTHTSLMDTCEQYREIYYSQKEKEGN